MEIPKIIKPKPIKKKEYNNTPEYNKAYYEKNKDKIKDTLKEKCICSLCGRIVSHQRLNSHKLTSICKGNRPEII
jgi:hypothetical protein